MEILRGDLHVHTRYSKEPRIFHFFKTLPFYGPEVVIKQSIKHGMNVVAITEHNTIRGADVGAKIAKKKYKDIVFVKGEEVSTKKGHMVALGINETIKPWMSPEETIDEIKKQGGVSIAAHPFTVYGLGHRIYSLKLDGAEVLNPWASLLNANRGVYKVLPNLDLAPIGSSDAHGSWIIGRMFTEMKATSFSVDGVLKAIRKRKTCAKTNLTVAELLANLVQGIGISITGVVRRNVRISGD